jgi:hypothetical protein
VSRGQVVYSTRHCIFRSLDESDSSAILNLRTSDRSRTLNEVSDQLSDQVAYMRNYRKRFEAKEEIYFGISTHNSEHLVGLVRLTNLNDPLMFNWASLVFAADSPPIVPIDAIIATYTIGFDVLGRASCGPFPVRDDVPRVLALHHKIGMSIVVGRDETTTYLLTTAQLFREKVGRFRAMGVGYLSLT